MTPIWDKRAKPFVLRLMAEKIPGAHLGFGNCQVMAVADREGRLCAGVVFHNWSPRAGVIEMTVAASDRRWMSRRVITEAFAYAFVEAGCQMVVFRVDPDDAHIRRLIAALGGQEYIIPRLRGRDTPR